METTKLSSKGQIIFPKSIRAAHNWDAGVEFSIENTHNGILLRPLKPFPSTRLKDMSGCAACRATAKTVQDMEVGVQRAVKDRHVRG